MMHIKSSPFGSETPQPITDISPGERTPYKRNASQTFRKTPLKNEAECIFGVRR